MGQLLRLRTDQRDQRALRGQSIPDPMDLLPPQLPKDLSDPMDQLLHLYQWPR